MSDHPQTYPPTIHPDAKLLAEAIVDTVREPLLVLDNELRVLRANNAFVRHFRTAAEETVGRRVYDLGNGQWDIPSLHDLLEGVLKEHAVFNDFEVEHRFDHIGRRTILLNARSVRDLPLILLAMEDVTKRQAAQKKQLKRGKLLGLFIEHAPSALAMFDRDMRYLYVSHRWRSDYGLGERPLQGHSHYEISPEIPAKWREAHRLGLAGEVLRAEADRFERADGSVQWVRWEIRPWYSAPDEIGGIVIFAEDITDIKQAEESLRRAKEEWERTFDSVPDLIAILDARHRIVRVNKALANRLGLAAEDCLGRPCYEAIHGVDQLPAACPHAQTMADACEHEAEVHEERLGGHFLVTTTPLLNDGGQMTGAVHIARDITERKLAEEALRESELFYRQLLDSIPGMVFTTRPDGYCDFQSQPWVDFTGVPMSEHLGDGWNRLLHPDDRPRAFAAWRDAVEERAPYDLEYRVRRHDGAYEWFKVRGRPIRNAAGEIVRWFGTALNIDQLVRIQEELCQAKAAAEAATRAKSEFLANMSHEIRTPMTIFMAALEHLLQIDRGPERRQLLEMADDAARRLRALIDDILDFSRIEARRIDLEDAPFDLRGCVHEAVEMFALPAREKGLRLETLVAENVPRIVAGDCTRLGQVLTNLVSNAVKFTPAGEVRVAVQRHGNLIEFSVADTGIGIPEGKHHLLFQSFNQIDSSFHRQYGGSGLGLSISQGLVELMGGRITVRSREEGGCLFSFALPLKPAVKQGLTMAAAFPESSGPGAAVRILLAEDEPMIRQVITMMLARRGWHTETAVSGREAIEKWERGAFDILLMDLQMPEMTGLEATGAIRGREAAGGKKRTCIIALTAHARNEVIDSCLQMGVDRVLIKPVQMIDLYAAIDSCLSA